jgi:hypothetical protein
VKVVGHERPSINLDTPFLAEVGEACQEILAICLHLEKLDPWYATTYYVV